MDDFGQQELRKAMEALDIRNQEMENKVAELTVQLNVAKHKLAEVQRERAELSNQSSPIYMLPDELFVEIWNYLRHRLGFPFVASWITRRWRNIVLDTPTLWCYIHVSPIRHIEPVKAELSRSKNCRLCITAYHWDFNITDIQYQERTENLMDIVLPHIHRLRVFWLHALPPSPRTATFAGIVLRWLRDAYAPQLTALQIQCALPQRPHSEPIFTGGAPILSEVAIHGQMAMQFDLNLLTGLTTLDIKDIPFRDEGLTALEFRNLMDASPLLRNLAIRGVCVDRNSPEDYSIIHIPSLRSLTLGYCKDDARSIWLFKVLSSPGLETLVLENMSSPAIEAFINSATSNSPLSKYPSVSKLSIGTPEFQDDLEVDEDDMSSFLLSLPLIDHLQFFGSDMSPEFTRALTTYGHTSSSGPQATATCPRLRTLTWMNWPYCSTNSQRVERLVCERSNMGFPISQLHVEKNQFENLELVSQERFRAVVDVVLHEYCE